jgi:hypothetical protein
MSNVVLQLLYVLAGMMRSPDKRQKSHRIAPCDHVALKISKKDTQRRMRKRASKPIRCGTAVVVIISGIGVVVGLPLTTGAPVTPGVALEVPGFGATGGIGAGTAVPGVVIGVVV